MGNGIECDLFVWRIGGFLLSLHRVKVIPFVSSESGLDIPRKAAPQLPFVFSVNPFYNGVSDLTNLQNHSKPYKML